MATKKQHSAGQPSLFDGDELVSPEAGAPPRQSLVVPFGKFKDQPADLLMAHSEYALWLLSAKYAILKRSHPQMLAWLVSHFGVPDTTPEHNRLQNRFLDADFRLQFFLCMNPGVVAQLRRLADPDVALAGWKKVLPGLIESRYADYFDPSSFSRAPSKSLPTRQRQAEQKAGAWAALLRDVDKVAVDCDRQRDATANEQMYFDAAGLPGIRRIWTPVLSPGKPRFEVEGADIEFEAGGRFSIGVSQASPSVAGGQYLSSVFVGFEISKRYRIEVKPFVGDDYPVILRAMLAKHCNTLLVESFEADGASWEQVAQVFGSRGIRVALLEDVLLTEIPECARRLPVPVPDKAALSEAARIALDQFHEQWLAGQTKA